jgi:hypothetical protein
MPHTFQALLRLNGKTATGIEVPPELIEELGGGKRPAIRVTINGYTYATTVGVMAGRFLIPVSAEHRGPASVEAGNTYTVTIEVDSAPRTVTVPDDLATAMAAVPGVRERFDALAPSHRKEHVRAIEDAKTEATRVRRIDKAIERLNIP